MGYNEIENLLNEIPDEKISREAKRATCGLLQKSWKYSHLNRINEKIKPAKDILQNYLDSEDCLAQRKLAKDRKRNKSLDITAKLYIEFFWKAYKGHYKNETEKTFINSFVNDIDSGKKIDKAWEDMFPGADDITKSIKEWVKSAVFEWAEYDNATYIQNLHLDNLHTAMTLLKEELESPMPEIADSVEEVLTPKILNDILDHLKEKRYPHCQFTITPITRALTTGKLTSYVGTFFNKEYQYNLTELERYISRLNEISEEYTEVKKELDGILGQYHYL